MTVLRLPAPAKINLVLDVLGKRDDGYHEIATVLHTLAWGDTLVFRPSARGLQLRCPHPGVPTDEGNLVARAARVLAKELGIRDPGVRIELVKRIPVGAGLGGGSSDAATALKGLLTWWGRSLSPARLRRVAADLGSDVPFFLGGGCALARGRGERLRPWPSVPGLRVALVNPGIFVSTSEVYRGIKKPLTSQGNYINLLRPAIKAKNPYKIGENLYNRLERVTLARYPVVERIKTELLACGATSALMSGSGPSVFALVPSPEVGREIIRRLGPRYPFVRITKTA